MAAPHARGVEHQGGGLGRGDLEVQGAREGLNVEHGPGLCTHSCWRWPRRTSLLVLGCALLVAVAVLGCGVAQEWVLWVSPLTSGILGAKVEKKPWTQTPLCCVRFVHIPKAGGTEFKRVARNFVVDLDTFHRPWAQFDWRLQERPTTEGRCFFATALRHPVDRFLSAFDFCLGHHCKRRFDVQGGFLEARPGWEDAAAYEAGNLTLAQFFAPHNRNATAYGDNAQTKLLGLRAIELPGASEVMDMTPSPPSYLNHRRKGIEIASASLVHLADDAEGRRVLERAKKVLAQMDIILLTEDLTKQMRQTFRSPHHGLHTKVRNTITNRSERANTARVKQRSVLTPENQLEVEKRNSLDMELYAFAAALIKKRRKETAVSGLRGKMMFGEFYDQHILAIDATRNSSLFNGAFGGSKKVACKARGNIFVPP